MASARENTQNPLAPQILDNSLRVAAFWFDVMLEIRDKEKSALEVLRTPPEINAYSR